MLKFYFNGIKEDGGKLQRCFYSDGKLCNYADGTITIYGRNYKDFSAGVHAAFDVSDDTDYQSDYICNEIIRVPPTHPLYAQVNAALALSKAHNAKTASKRQARMTPAQAVQQSA